MVHSTQSTIAVEEIVEPVPERATSFCLAGPSYRRSHDLAPVAALYAIVV